jgi:hypothetical protein
MLLRDEIVVKPAGLISREEAVPVLFRLSLTPIDEEFLAGSLT